ncbi:hypothetical protein GCM10007424_08670 [Flavobacterium suaedae]|uniref:Uncharacterized protein n=1 Tax=Flavobacterium suaedae TaxID=1767027 RepID=A0ABQ1JJY8_9FLAO|nr:hypothetical protein GCM10007424_08670 [Flavobacterium suaedae]
MREVYTSRKLPIFKLKKILFYTVGLITFILLIDIISKLINDMDRLTNYGWGYITGKLILFAVSLITFLILYTKVFRKKSN